MIEIHDLKKHYGQVKAVDGVSFTCPDGQITGLLGPTMDRLQACSALMVPVNPPPSG